MECSTFAEEFSFLSPLYSAVPPKDDSKAQLLGSPVSSCLIESPNKIVKLLYIIYHTIYMCRVWEARVHMCHLRNSPLTFWLKVIQKFV